MQFIENESMVQGRFIHSKDIDQKAKVVVIGQNIKAEVFDDKAKVIGEMIQLSGIPFKIVGVYSFKEGKEIVETYFSAELQQIKAVIAAVDVL